jgi:beta-1,4-mannosyl-glycoprotein beta-1,4-N-acetylglucosaminyltransferase
MNKPKILDCITFFDNNYIFDIRYNILKNFVDYFVICESLYDHKGNKKEKNFKWKKNYNKKKIIYRCIKKPFPKKNSPWENQAIQREILLSYTDFANGDDYIFFSDPDEIPNPKLLKNFSLKKKYGIFLQKCFNYKFNLFNKFESPWEGTRVAKKKNLKSIDFMRQSVKSKNLKYNFFRIDKERSIEIYENGGWHFNNIMQPKDISLKLKTFAHQEFSGKNFSNIETIKKKIKNRFDLFNRGHKYKAIKLDSSFPIFITKNKKKFKNYIEKID